MFTVTGALSGAATSLLNDVFLEDECSEKLKNMAIGAATGGGLAILGPVAGRWSAKHANRAAVQAVLDEAATHVVSIPLGIWTTNLVNWIR